MWRGIAIGTCLPLFLGGVLSGQAQRTTPSPNDGQAVPKPLQPGTEAAIAQDAGRVKRLMNEGARIEGKHVTVWFPPALSGPEAESLASRLDAGVAELRRLIGTHDWQAIGTQRATFYLVDEPRFTSYARSGAIFVSVASMKAGRVAFLGGAVLELLRPKSGGPPTDSDPVWLTRGVQEYLAQAVGPQVGLNEPDFLGVGPSAEADQRCASLATSAEGKLMLSYVGVSRRPAELMGPEASKYQPPFLSCSLSFVKFLIDQVGVEGVVSLFGAIPANNVDAAVERLMKRPLATLRDEWRRRIGI